MQIVVQEWERVLLYRDGRFEEVLEPGRHRRVRWRRQQVRVALRPQLFTVPSQEVLSSDGLSLRVTLAVVVRTADPRRWHEEVEAPHSFVYSAVQVALREAVASRTLDEVLAARNTMGEEMRAPVQRSTEAVGVVVESIAVRDLMVPAELRRAAAEVATARAKGLASLERARSEVASTRALANAGRMLAEQPGLLQLRTLQAVESGQATIVLTQGAEPPSAARGT